MADLPDWPSAPEPATAGERREAFNEQHFYERARSGEISTQLLDERPPRPDVQENEPPGTVARMVLYIINDVLVALVHKYVHADGTIGASGLPDPKVVVTEDGRTLREFKCDEDPPANQD